MNQYKLDTVESRRDFIQNEESGVYEGTNEDGESVTILMQKGVGMTVHTIHASKPNWYEVVEYDADGYQESVTYEPVPRK